MKNIAIVLSCILYLAGCAATGKYSGMTGQHAKTLSGISTKYLLYVPEDYKPDEPFPLVLFLHGSGERGTDINKVKVHGLPKLADQGTDFPFIIISPQCPPDQRWNIDSLELIMKAVTDSFNIDSKRIYLTGLSMGGFGSWAYSIAFPEKFAAVVPVCGGGDSSKVCRIRNIPVWVFHGAQDKVVPLQSSVAMVNALKECGGNVKLTVYPDAGHDSWTETYNNPELYKWLLAQRKQ